MSSGITTNRSRANDSYLPHQHRGVARRGLDPILLRRVCPRHAVDGKRFGLGWIPSSDKRRRIKRRDLARKKPHINGAA